MIKYILHTMSIDEGTELTIPFGPLHNIVEGHCVIGYRPLLLKELDEEVVDSLSYRWTRGSGRSWGITSCTVVVVIVIVVVILDSCPHFIRTHHEVIILLYRVVF